MAEQNNGNARPRPPQLRGITRAQGLNGAPSPGTIAVNAQRTDIATDPQIVCPNCRTEIKLTESLAAPLIAETRRKFDQQLAAKEADFGRREAQLKQASEEIAKAREAVDEQVAAKLKAERSSIVETEAKRARLAIADELGARDRQLADLKQMLAANNEKLAAAQKIQADMNRQIEELRRRAEQGSQQLQGEALELELESLLRNQFPRDLIEPVPKGDFGGDVLHRVFGPGGQTCGTILWESKRTKRWSDDWLTKLRSDQRAAKAEVALIVSSALPKDIETFGLVDNVWVAEPRFAVPLAIVLRHGLIDLAGSRQAQEGQQTKMYGYLTGPRFRHRIDAIVEKFTDMQADLDRERKMMMRLWAKREEQLRGVLDSTAGLYGDLQGIAGRAMQEIESLDLLMIEAKSEAAE